MPNQVRKSKSEPVLPESFYERDVALVARELLGCLLFHDSPEGLTSGRIVETEAYLPQGDPACHGARGQTRRNASIFGPAGRAYVYAIHSRWCLNAVAEPTGIACAVLIRAVEPLIGIELMQARRGREKLLELTRGPGRLCQAFGIDRQLDGWNLTRKQTLWIERATQRIEPRVSRRIGVTSAHELLLRFYEPDNRFVSGKRNLS